MKKYIKTTTKEESPLLAIKEISLIVYVEDPNELEWYDTSRLMLRGYEQAAKSTVPDYSSWTRKQLLQLKEQDLNKFDSIRNNKVLFQILKSKDLTPNQLLYIDRRKTVSRGVELKEVMHILKLLKNCDDFYRLPSDKNGEFIKYLKKHDISLKQSDIENIINNLHIQGYSEGRYFNDGIYLGRALIMFEFCNPSFEFSCGKSLSDIEMPLKIYIKIDVNLSTKESVAVCAFIS